MLFCQEQAGGKKSSQAHNPNGVYFRNALLIQAHKKKEEFMGGNFGTEKNCKSNDERTTPCKHLVAFPLKVVCIFKSKQIYFKNSRRK